MSDEKSYWVEVTASRFDWVPNPTMMVSGVKGQVMHLPGDAVKIGEAAGQLKRISKPKGYLRSKVAQVVDCPSCAKRRASLWRVWNSLTGDL